MTDVQPIPKCPHCGKPLFRKSVRGTPAHHALESLRGRGPWTVAELSKRFDLDRKNVSDVAGYFVRRGIWERLSYGKYQAIIETVNG